MEVKKKILTKEIAAQKINRLALEVAENLAGEKSPLIIIGIRDIGYLLAEKIALLLSSYINTDIEVVSATLDKSKPGEILFNKEINLHHKNILLIDDVCNSGKTLLYALKPLLDFYPKRILVLVLVERMHKLFPIQPDFVGLSLATTDDDFIKVELENGDFSAIVVSHS
ncbi:MAG: phosphoribosyltransferase [Bacteroidetes bacterium]|nr:phosphoribosyltransferase [Bacteroidota bacterium]